MSIFQRLPDEGPLRLAVWPKRRLVAVGLHDARRHDGVRHAVDQPLVGGRYGCQDAAELNRFGAGDEKVRAQANASVEAAHVVGGAIEVALADAFALVEDLEDARRLL